MKKTRNADPTFGDLVAAAGEVAFECSNSDVEAYNLARFALIELIRKTSQPSDFDKEFESLQSPSSFIH
ncbi:MAG TPA: hypothetical protein VJQ55_00065 [Candidatus Binatia bacterium]|nr:hypothetical protein [Candidatus Binatia bacterium]